MHVKIIAWKKNEKKRKIVFMIFVDCVNACNPESYHVYANAATLHVHVNGVWENYSEKKNG